MQYIKQTNRTILFDEINPNTNNIFTLIGDTKGKESLADDEIKEINDKLSVTSYLDFINKFNPAVYMEIELQKEFARFSFETPKIGQYDVVPIKLNLENRLLSMFDHMLDSKHSGEFPQESLTSIVDYLLPKLDTAAFINLRREIKESFIAHDLESAKGKMDCLVLHHESLLQLQLFLKESRGYLIPDVKFEDDVINIQSGDKTQIQVLEASRRFREMEPPISGENLREFEQFVKDYIISNNVKNGQWMLFNILVSCGFENGLAETCMDLYNKSLDFYSKIIINFWKKASYLLQTMLGIKLFFDQHTVEDGIMPPTLLITNCPIDYLLQEKYRTNLSVYLETVNLKSFYASTIWYAIIPKIEFINVAVKKQIRERFAGNEQGEEMPANSVEVVHLLLDILTRYRIQAFLSTCVSENNSFLKFSETGIRLFEESFKPFEKVNQSEYIIPCIPNFTIIPKEHAKLVIGRKYVYEEFGDQKIHPSSSKTTWLSGVYIEASFIAAGLFAACQCPTFLSTKFPGKVDLETQGVAYRFSKDNNRKATPTTMKKEIFAYSKERLEEINELWYGVVFGPEKEGITILADYTLAYHSGEKDCVATVQTMTYIERIIRHDTQDFRSNLIIEFFKNRPDSIWSKWMKTKKLVNSILKEGENLEYHINDRDSTCTIELEFSELLKEEKVNLSR